MTKFWGAKSSQDNTGDFSGGGGGTSFEPEQQTKTYTSRSPSYINKYDAARKQSQYLPEQPDNIPFAPESNTSRTPSPSTAHYSQDFADQWMQDQFDAVFGDGGKYAKKYQDIYEMLDSGDFDAWYEWITHQSENYQTDATLALLRQTFGDDYADLIKNIYGADGWNKENLRAIFDAEYAKNPSWASRAASGDAQAWMDMIGNDKYWGDDWINFMRNNGWGGGWAQYEKARKDNPELTFANWLTSAGDQEQWDLATDYYTKMLYGKDMYGDPGYDVWSGVVDSPLVYGESYPNYSQQYDADDYYSKWYGTSTGSDSKSKDGFGWDDVADIASALAGGVGGLIGEIINGYNNPDRY